MANRKNHRQKSNTFSPGSGDSGLSGGETTGNAKADQKSKKGSERGHLDKTNRYDAGVRCFSRLDFPRGEKERRQLEPKLCSFDSTPTRELSNVITFRTSLFERNFRLTDRPN